MKQLIAGASLAAIMVANHANGQTTELPNNYSVEPPKGFTGPVQPYDPANPPKMNEPTTAKPHHLSFHLGAGGAYASIQRNDGKDLLHVPHLKSADAGALLINSNTGPNGERAYTIPVKGQNPAIKGVSASVLGVQGHFKFDKNNVTASPIVGYQLGKGLVYGATGSAKPSDKFELKAGLLMNKLNPELAYVQGVKNLSTNPDSKFVKQAKVSLTTEGSKNLRTTAAVAEYEQTIPQVSGDKVQISATGGAFYEQKTAKQNSSGYGVVAGANLRSKFGTVGVKGGYDIKQKQTSIGVTIAPAKKGGHNPKIPGL